MQHQRDAALVAVAEMQHQLQRCSTSCRDAAPAAEMQHQLQRCMNGCSCSTSYKMQHQLQTCCFTCRRSTFAEMK